MPENCYLVENEETKVVLIGFLPVHHACLSPEDNQCRVLGCLLGFFLIQFGFLSIFKRTYRADYFKLYNLSMLLRGSSCKRKTYLGGSTEIMGNRVA